MAAFAVNARTAGVSRFQQDFEQRPMMLKDFLIRDGGGYCNSCSSSSLSKGFRTKPRNKSCGKSTAVIRPSEPAIMLLRSRSRRAAATTISAIQKVINAVKFFQFDPVKPGSAPHRSGSRNSSETMAKVKVKDILRWRSFRDLEEDNSSPSDAPASPDPTATTSSSSKMSSWCDSDFTAEESDPWVHQNEEFLMSKKSCLREDWSNEESEQQSPVSVLYSSFQEIQEYAFPLGPISLGNVEGMRMHLRRYDQELEFITRNTVGEEEVMTAAAEKKAMQLLSDIIADEPEESHYNLMMDFFMDEIMSSMEGKVKDGEIVRVARLWKSGEIDESYQWEVEDKRKAYVKDMEKGTNWNRFDHEQEEISRELQVELLDEILDDILADFLAH